MAEAKPPSDTVAADDGAEADAEFTRPDTTGADAVGADATDPGEDSSESPDGLTSDDAVDAGLEDAADAGDPGDAGTDAGIDVSEPVPCVSDCKPGEILDCVDDDTIIGCWYQGKCKKLQTKECPPGYYCVPGQDYCECADTEELVCTPLFSALSKKTACGGLGSYYKSCPPPGCFDAQCVTNPSITQITPWPTGKWLEGVAETDDGYLAVGWKGGLVQKSGGSYTDKSQLSVAYHFVDAVAYSPTHLLAVDNAVAVLVELDENFWGPVHQLVVPPQIAAKFPEGVPLPQWEPTAMWSQGPGTVFIVGNGGTIFSYDGTSSGVMGNPYLAQLGYDYEDIWGSAPDDVYAVGHKGMFVHYDGSSWKPVGDLDQAAGGAGGEWRSVHGRSWDDVYATRHVQLTGATEVWRFDGIGWAPMASQPDASDTLAGFGDLYAATDGTLYTLAALHYAHWDGLSWTVVPTKRVEPLYAIGGRGDGAVAVGPNGLIYELDGPDFELITKYTTNPPITKATGWDEMVDVWGTGDGVVVASGSNGTAVIRHPDGAVEQWDTPELIHPQGRSPVWRFKESFPRRPWTRVWASSADNVYIGGHGAVRRWDGKDWHDVEIPGFKPNSIVKTLYGTGPNDICLGGRLDHLVTKESFVACFDGVAWSLESSPDVGALWAKSPGEWYLAGAGVLRREGKEWIPVGDVQCADTCYLTGFSTGELVVASAGADLDQFWFHYMTADGEWFYVELPSDWPCLFDIHPTADGNFLGIHQFRGLFRFDRQKLNDLAKPVPGKANTVVGPQKYITYLEPLVALPEYIRAVWQAPDGQFFFAAPDNGLWSSP